MRKLFISFISILFLVLLVACGGQEVDGDTAEKYREKAEEVIMYLNDGDYEAIHRTFNAEMKDGLPLSEMESLTPMIQNAGSFEEIEESLVEEQDGLFVTVSKATYSEESRTFTITFTAEDEIAGLFVK